MTLSRTLSTVALATLLLGSVQKAQPARLQTEPDAFLRRNVVRDVLFSPDGKTLAVTFEKAKCGPLLLEAATRQERCRCAPVKEAVSCLVFSPDGRLLVGAVGADVYCWDVGSGTILRHFPGQLGLIFALAFAPDGKTLAVSEERGVSRGVRLLDAATGRELRTLTGQTRPAYWLCFSADGKRLGSASAAGLVEKATGETMIVAGALCFWDVCMGKIDRRVAEPGPGTVVSPNFRTIARPWPWTAPPRIILQDLNGGKKIDQCVGEHGVPLLFSPDAKTLVTGGLRGPIRLWDAASGKQLRWIPPYGGPGVLIKAFSPDGNWLVAIGDGAPETPLLRIWDVTTGREVPPVSGSVQRQGIIR